MSYLLGIAAFIWMLLQRLLPESLLDLICCCIFVYSDQIVKLGIVDFLFLAGTAMSMMTLETA